MISLLHQQRSPRSKMKLKPDQYQTKMSEVSPFMGGRGKLTTDDVIEELFRNRTWKYTALIFSLMVNWFAGTPIVFITSFAGFFLSFFLFLFSVSYFSIDVNCNIIHTTCTCIKS